LRFTNVDKIQDHVEKVPVTGNVVRFEHINLAALCVQDSETGYIILKMVNHENDTLPMKVNLSRFGKMAAEAEQTVLAGNPDAENTFENTKNIVPASSVIKTVKNFDYAAPPMSLTVIRIKKNGGK